MIPLKFPFLKSWSFFGGGYGCLYLFISMYLYLYTCRMRCFPMYFSRFPPNFHWASFDPTLGHHLHRSFSRIWPSQQKFFWRNVSSMCHQTSRVGGNLQGFQHGKPDWKPEDVPGKFLHEKSMLLLHLTALFIWWKHLSLQLNDVDRDDMFRF